MVDIDWNLGKFEGKIFYLIKKCVGGGNCKRVCKIKNCVVNNILMIIESI